MTRDLPAVYTKYSDTLYTASSSRIQVKYVHAFLLADDDCKIIQTFLSIDEPNEPR